MLEDGSQVSERDSGQVSQNTVSWGRLQPLSSLSLLEAENIQLLVSLGDCNVPPSITSKLKEVEAVKGLDKSHLTGTNMVPLGLRSLVCMEPVPNNLKSQKNKF